jgi:hypothetical protein
MLPLMAQTNVGVASTSPRFDRDFPTFSSKGLHQTPKLSMVKFLRSLATEGTSRLAN